MSVVALALVSGADALAAPSRHVQVDAQVSEVPADGRSTLDLRLEVLAADGTPVPDGTVVPLQVSHGRVVKVTPTVGGFAHARLRASTWPGPVGLRARGYSFGGAPVSFGRGEPTSLQLHLHATISEGNARMEDHVIEAEAWGVDVLWWTDHDVGYVHPDLLVDRLDLEAGVLTESLPVFDLGFVTSGFELEGSDLIGTVGAVLPQAAHVGTYGLRLEGSGNEPFVPRTGTWAVAGRTPFPSSMLSGLVVRFDVRPNSVPGADRGELFVPIVLSSHGVGPDYELYDSIVLYDSPTDYAALSDSRTLYVPMDLPTDAWTTVEVDLPALASTLSRGLDQHVDSIQFELRAAWGETASYDFDEFEFDAEVIWEDLRDRQRDYLATLPYTPTHLMGSEITGFGNDLHLNAYGDDVPLLPYELGGFDGASAVDFVHSLGGIVSWNHVFGILADIQSAADRADAVADAIARWEDTAGYGADMIEVGYRSRFGTMADFLEVWDAISMGHGFMTGIGTSDHHDTTPLIEFTNNFVTWVAPATVASEDFIFDLKRGNAWFGDPTVFPDGVDVQVEAVEALAVMGQAVVGAVGDQTVRLTADPLQAGWWVRTVVNGAVVDEVPVPTDGLFVYEVLVSPVGEAVVRFEVLAELADDPVLLSNPIYFVDAGVDVPVERLPVP